MFRKCHLVEDQGMVKERNGQIRLDMMAIMICNPVLAGLLAILSGQILEWKIPDVLQYFYFLPLQTVL